MALVREIKGKHGGTIRIFDDCVAKTPEEKAAVKADYARAVGNVLTYMVNKYGVEEAGRRLDESARELGYL